MKSIKKLELRYSDTDQMGVIYHANYFSFFEQGRTKFLKDVGYDYHMFEENGIIYPVRDVSCTYLKSIRFGDELFLETTIHKFTRIKTTYYHEIKDTQGDIKCKAYTTVVCVDKNTFKPFRMDEAIPEVYNAYLEVLKKEDE